MIKYRAIMHLDGGYKRDFPEPVAFSTRDGPKWKITKAGPRYLNVYEVIEFDAVGQRWLEENERIDAPRTETKRAAPKRERVDRFGRTEAEIEKSLAHWKTQHAIARAWPDPEGRKSAVYLGNGAVDEVALKQLRGEPIDWKYYGYDGPPPPNLSGQALEDFRRGLIARGNAGIRK